MKQMVDIEVVIEEAYINPKVKILTREKTGQVENIIAAIEDVSESDYPVIGANDGEKVMLISQRQIIRVYTEERRVLLQTEEGIFPVRRPLKELEYLLNEDRFVRISNSEIINLYMVKCFDVTIAGTIAIEFDNGLRSWVSRSKVRDIKRLLKKRYQA